MTRERQSPILEARKLSKRFGGVVALEDIEMAVQAGEVTCLLGDNGAGKSTLIKILSGVFPPTSGECLLNGNPMVLSAPREALAQGIATVYQDLAMVPLMSVWRNFHLGSERTLGRGPLRRIDVRRSKAEALAALQAIGIHLGDPNQPVGSLSGGERQVLAIARALHFGARVLILDEPTAALGVRQSDLVLNEIRKAAEGGVAVILVTHNPHHAHPVGDHFVVLRKGRVIADRRKEELAVEELAGLMAG
ncbi:MAG: ATP-binding cassette domain-containing protein [Gemmatimonadota bacterium]|jgi:simple sugar transport system ATP-binding protein